jgi:hypothetical protein
MTMYYDRNPFTERQVCRFCFEFFSPGESVFAPKGCERNAKKFEDHEKYKLHEYHSVCHHFMQDEYAREKARFNEKPRGISYAELICDPSEQCVQCFNNQKNKEFCENQMDTQFQYIINHHNDIMYTMSRNHLALQSRLSPKKRLFVAQADAASEREQSEREGVIRFDQEPKDPSPSKFHPGQLLSPNTQSIIKRK